MLQSSNKSFDEQADMAKVHEEISLLYVLAEGP